MDRGRTVDFDGTYDQLTARSIHLRVSYEQVNATRTVIAKAIDAGFQHIVLGLPAPYPDEVAHWIADELVNTST